MRRRRKKNKMRSNKRSASSLIDVKKGNKLLTISWRKLWQNILRLGIGSQRWKIQNWNKRSVLRRQSRDRNRNIKWSVYIIGSSHLIGLFSFTWISLLYKFTRFFVYFRFLSDEGPMLETLDYTIRIGSTPTILYFDFYLYSAYAVRYVYYPGWPV